MPFPRYRRRSRRGPGVPPGTAQAACRRFAVALPVLATALLLAAGVAADAALYKWTDANGRVVYSDQPPTGNVKVETLSGPPPPANPNAVKEMVNKDAELKKLQLDRAEAAKKGEQGGRRRAPRPRRPASGCATRSASSARRRRCWSGSTRRASGSSIDAADPPARARESREVGGAELPPVTGGRRRRRGSPVAVALLLLEVGLVDLDVRLGLQRMRRTR